MRDAEAIEAELMEISAIPDDSTKLERIITWCAVHPDEVPFAIKHFVHLHATRTRGETRADVPDSGG